MIQRKPPRNWQVGILKTQQQKQTFWFSKFEVSFVLRKPKTHIIHLILHSPWKDAATHAAVHLTMHIQQLLILNFNQKSTFTLADVATSPKN